ncbi:MAG: glucose-1-phosphate adenylyltransferase subunit GlgD [Clostridia bacterium]|nr:glucose-1-phosphate adenylyltransferase subunit GlgD [Clostridia bacterium]
MKDTMGIILTRNQEVRLNELTEIRDVSALPFGGRYRLIDFVLSNMVNSGIINVGIATQFNYSSLMDHVGTGKPWDLNRKAYGLFFLPPQVRLDVRGGVSVSGDVDILHGVLTYLHRSRQKYVVVASGNVVCSMTFDAALEAHKASGADITVIYTNLAENDEQLSRSTTYCIDDSGRVKNIYHNQPNPKYTAAGMDMYIIERALLQSLIEEAYAKGSHDFITDILAANMNYYNIYAYRYDGFVSKVDSIRTYYNTSMNMLDTRIRHELFEGSTPIYTKVKDQVPTKYLSNAKVKNSLIADGCVIDGTVENSIIFRGVHIGKDTVVKNSIVMQTTIIQDKCDLENVVIDKECTLRSGKRLIGQPNFPFILPKRTLI